MVSIGIQAKKRGKNTMTPKAIKKMTLDQIKTQLTQHAIKFDSKANKETLRELAINRVKTLNCGNRTGNEIYGTKSGNYANEVCSGIAKGIITSKKDIRKLITPKYSFNQTLARLALEGIIVFTDKKQSEFELTNDGKIEANNFYNETLHEIKE